MAEAGRCFGELSVIGKNWIRNATIVADDPTLLVCITKELYYSFVCESLTAEVAQRSSFIAMHPLFRGWQTAYRNLLSENLQYRKLKFGEHMVRQGDPFDTVCFIIDGQVKLTVNPIEHTESFASLLANSKNKSHVNEVNDDGDEEEDDNFIDPFKSISVMQRRKLKKTDSFYASELRFRDIDVCTLGSQAVVGDIESILDLNKHISTAVCIQETSFYEMDCSSFLRFIVKKNPETYEKMRRLVFEKLLHRNSFFEGTIPIYRALLTFFDKPKPKDNRKEIIKTYNTKKANEKQPGPDFFEQLSKGKSIHGKNVSAYNILRQE